MRIGNRQIITQSILTVCPTLWLLKHGRMPLLKVTHKCTFLITTLCFWTLGRIIIHGYGSTGPAGRSSKFVWMAVVGKVCGGKDYHSS